MVIPVEILEDINISEEDSVSNDSGLVVYIKYLFFRKKGNGQAMNEISRTLGIIWVSIAALAAVSCVTPKDANMASPGTAGKSPVATSPAPIEAGEAKAASKDPGSQKQRLFQYVVALSDITQPFTNADKEFLSSLPPAPESGSLREAAIVVGTLRSCLEEAQDVQSFKEKDLNVAGENASMPNQSIANPSPNTSSKKLTAANSLERRLGDKQVQLVQSLQKNMLLRSHRVFHLVQKALSVTDNSEAYAKELNQLIVDEASQWAQLLPKSPMAPTVPAEAAQSLPVAAEAPLDKDEQTRGMTPLVLSPNSQQPEGILASAQQLADNGQFKQAVDQARKIAVGDPAYNAAKEKINTFSNQAVQSLRQKAAQAFQNAMPAADAAVKSAYLEQARAYLQQALSDFPEADSLDTVKENLAVITKDVERIDTQRGSAKKAKAGSDEDEAVIKD